MSETTQEDIEATVSRLRRTAKELERSPRLEAQAEARRCRHEADSIERYYSEGEG